MKIMTTLRNPLLNECTLLMNICDKGLLYFYDGAINAFLFR